MFRVVKCVAVSGKPGFDVCLKVNAVCVRSVNTSSEIETSERGPGQVSKFPNPGATALRKGTGGRSSFNGTVCTVFGASGYLGRHLCNRIAKIGTQIIIPFRSDPYDIRGLKVVGDLGQVLFFPFYLRNEESIYKAVKYSNVAINLIGSETEKPSFTYDEVHVDGARLIAKVCREAGVQRLIHFSALNSSPNPKQHTYYAKGGSQFLKSKYYGELAVREEFPEAIIFRPADMFGLEDKFLNYFYRFTRRNLLSISLWNKGRGSFKQPVYVSDVAQGVVNAIFDPMSPGKTYDCVGPKRYELIEIVRFINTIVQRNESEGWAIKDMRYTPWFYLRQWWWPYIFKQMKNGNCLDKIEREMVSDELVPGNLTLEDLGVKLTPMENIAWWDLRPKRLNAWYGESMEELPMPPFPKTVPSLVPERRVIREFKEATV